MIFDKEMLLLYAVTDQAWVGKQTLLEQIEDALEGGATMIQLREKTLDDDSFLNEAIQVRKLCHTYNVPLIINDNIDVALKSGADGVHVGIEDISVEEIRKKVPYDFIIGATCKTVDQAKNAEDAGADYMGVGAMFTSSTKTNAVRISGEQLCEIVSSVSIPAVAIGGITYDNICAIKGSRVSGVAVVSAIFASEDIKKATKLLKKRVKSVLEK